MSQITTEVSIATLSEKEGVWDIGSLMSYLSQIEDPRQARGIRYDLVTVLLLAKLAGQDSMKGIADWVRLRETELVNLLGLQRASVPHQTTYERVLGKLDFEQVEGIIGAYFRQSQGKQVMVSIDGKVLRGTIPEGQRQGTHLLAAYQPDSGVVLMQIEVGDHANEIVEAPKLLQSLDLRDCVVIGDAMFTQTELCEQIVLAGGDYLLPVKANQKHMQQAIADLFVPAPVSPGHSPVSLPETFCQTLDIGHGRIEQRYLTLSSQLNDYLDFPYVQQVFRLQRVVQRQKTGKLSYQVIFGITSLSASDCSPEQLMQLIRQHWHIENRLHYVRDVTFHEDACRIRHLNRQRLLATFNNLIIGLIRLHTDFDYIPDARRYFDAHYSRAFALFL